LKHSLNSTSEAASADRSACMLCGGEDAKVLYPFFETFQVVRCRSCGFVYSTLPTNKEVMEQLYDAAYYRADTRNDYYFHNCVTDATVDKDDSNIRDFRKGLSLIETYRSGGKLLDVGCGPGVFLSLAKERGWDVTGVDVSPFAVSYASGSLGHNAIAGELEEVGFPEKYFDVVTLWDVIEHLPAPIRTLREVHRVLKDDGLVFVDTPNERSLLKVLSRATYCLTAGKFRYAASKMYHQWHLSYFTGRTLHIALSKAGFRIDRMRRKCISLRKARALPWERLIVALVSWPERLLGRETELIAVARKSEAA